MILMKRFKIRSYEMGLYFRDREFKGLLDAGTHWMLDPLHKVRVEIVSQRDPWQVHDKLDVIVKSATGPVVGSDHVSFVKKVFKRLFGVQSKSPTATLKDRAVVLDLKDHERTLVWIDGRFSHVLPSGLYAYWTGFKDMKVEVIDARNVRFEHDDFKVIVRSRMAQQVLDICSVERHHVGVLFQDGDYVETLLPGEYAFWKGAADARVVEIDMRETMADVSGQEIMTADKVTMRMNAVITYRVVEARKAVSSSDDVRQALYREAQLALRAVVGARELDAFLADKDAVAQELEEAVRRRAGELGLEVVSVGIGDVILPGDMKDLMNKVKDQGLYFIAARFSCIESDQPSLGNS